MNDFVKTITSNGVAHIVLNRPERKNALNNDVMNALTAALNAANNDDAIKVVLLSGAEGNFSSGMDLTADFQGEHGTQAYANCMQALMTFDKPLIAALSGFAIGGGATIAFHADIVYVGKNLRMRLPFVSLGLVPEFSSSYLLQTNIGYRRAAEIMFTAEWIDAARAYESGIATAVLDNDELLDKALAKAQEIARWPVNSLRLTKQCLRNPHLPAIKAAMALELEAMAKQIGSPENIEAFMAFVEKREPNF